MGMAKTISLPGRDDHVLGFNSVQEDFVIGRASAVVACFVDDGRIDPTKIVLNFILMSTNQAECFYPRIGRFTTKRWLTRVALS